jgi:pimeloyl-ACP methyl ester carboxylesterase
MEREVTIPIPKTKKVIYGKLRGSVQKPLVLLIHGLHGNLDTAMYYNLARFLEKKGFASFRFALYGSRSNQRTLHHTTLKIHAQDVNTVVRYFRRKRVKRFAAVGHSYGGPTVLLSDTSNFFAVVLLDLSYKTDFHKGLGARWIKEMKAYLRRGRDHYLIGKAMVDEADQLDWDHLTSKLTTPALFIMAEHGDLDSGAKQYIQEAKGLTKLVTIRGARHKFLEHGKLEQVFAHTLKWLKKYA